MSLRGKIMMFGSGLMLVSLAVLGIVLQATLRDYLPGQTRITDVLGIAFLIGAACYASAFFIVDRFILVRLIRLTHEVQSLSVGGDPDRRVAAHGADELSTLAHEINRMLEGIEQARQARRTDEERFRALIEHSSDLILVLNRDATIRYVSPALKPLLGYEIAQVYGHSLFEFIHADDRVAAVAAFTHRLAHPGLSDVQMEARARHQDGSFRVMQLIGANLLDNPAVAGLVINGRDITERKHAEEALRESEERWRTYIEQANDLVFALDASGRVTWVNRAVCDTFGYREAELLGQSPLLIIAPEARPATHAALQDILNGAQVERFETEALTRDQRHIALEVRGRTLRKNDLIVGTFHIARDITEHRRAEKALQESNARFHALVEGIPDIVYLKDAQGHNLYVNRAYEIFAGTERANIVGKCDDEIMPPELAECYRQSDEQVLAHGNILRIEETSAERDGQVTCFETIRSPIFDAAGHPSGLVGVSRDITERKRIEEALRESEERYRAVVEQATEGIFVYDLETREILEANPAFQKMLGYTAEEMRAIDLYWIVAHSRASAERSSEPVSTGEQAWVGERQYRRKDGSWVDVEVSGSKISFRSKDAVSVVVRDIAERKRAEAVLKGYSEQLEQMVEARTRELRDAQEQLIRQERLATLGKLAGGIAHELRSPLSAIKNAAYYLKMCVAEPTEDAREMLQILDQQVDVSAHIIGSLLDFARPKTPTLQKAHLPYVIEAAVRQCNLPENIFVQWQVAENLPSIMLDAAQMQLVFSNVVTNAAQAMPNGGHLTIAVYSTGERMGATFTDTGVGIAADGLDKVFQPLYTTRVKGIGLGLALCKMLVEAHRGTISVTSELGKGTTFAIDLPGAEG